MKKKITATVLSQKEIAPRIFDMWIATDLAEQAKAGQFIGVYPKDRSTLLPRPISICQVSDKKDALRIVYRIAGQGTAEFSSYTEGDSVEILGTLGNGFPTEAAEGKKVFLMGGGIGIPPMLELARELPASAEKQIIVGYRDNQLFLKEDLEENGTVYRGWQCRHKGQCHECHRRKCIAGRCDLRVRTDAHASCDQKICGRKRNQGLYLSGRAYGLWRGCLPGLRGKDQRSGSSFSCA